MTSAAYRLGVVGPRQTAGFGVLCSVALLLGGCASTRGGPIPYDTTGAFRAPDPPRMAALESDYKIAPMDTVSIKVFRQSDLSGDYQVDLTGKISLPLIGEVAAADLTTAELDQRVTAKYSERYLENPDVSVGVKESAKRSITVDGAVKTAGSFPTTGSMTLMQAVAMAGGLGEDANARRIAVFRTIGGQRQAAAFDLVSIRRGEHADPAVYPGDIVVVDGNSVKALYKQIMNSLPVFSLFRPF